MKTKILTLSLLAASLVAHTGCAVDEPVSDAHEAKGTAHPYFEVFKGSDNRHYFHLSAANHEIVLSSQGYSSRTAALAGVIAVQENASDLSHYDLREARNGRFYFNLKAKNGQVVGTSELYATRASAERGIQAVSGAVEDYNLYWAGRTGARFVVFEGQNGRFYFRLHTANCANVLSSQGYLDEASALNATFSVVDNGTDPTNYDVRQSANGGYYFNLIASNGQIVGSSEVYSSKYNAERARNAIIALLPTIELL